jgi:hypothetical protein
VLQNSRNSERAKRIITVGDYADKERNYDIALIRAVSSFPGQPPKSQIRSKKRARSDRSAWSSQRAVDCMTKAGSNEPGYTIEQLDYAACSYESLKLLGKET